MKFLSLFSGIGGFEQAAFKLGWELAAFAEIDKFAIQSYRAIYGEEHMNLGDVSKIPNFLLPSHDVLVGGFPCQAFSVAGERAGMAFECPECSFRTTLDFNRYANRDFSCTLCGHDMEAVDGRGLLFFEVARVAKFMQPKAIVLENVKGLVGHDKGRTLDTIVTTLSSIGYVVDFEILNSKFFGVPQNRERIFIVAIREDLKSPEPWTEESLKGSTVIPKGKRRLKEYEGVKTFNFPYPENDTVTTILRDILESEVDERFYLDDDKTAGLIAELNKHREKVNTGNDQKTASLCTGENLAATIDALPMSCETEVIPVLTPDKEKVRQNGRRFKEDGEEMFTLTAQDRHGVVIAPSGEIDVKGNLGGSYESGGRVYGVDGVSPTISARDFKGPKLVYEEEVPQSPIMVGMLDMKGNDAIRRVYDSDGCGPTLTTMGGGNTEPKIVERAGEVKRYDVEIPVRVRKHEIDEEALKSFLREGKAKVGKTVKEIAQETGAPLTEAEHWFRRDSSFAVPRPEKWLELKKSLNIQGSEWDRSVMEFEERPGVFEKANRVYDDSGISPTLTAASSDEKIVTRATGVTYNRKAGIKSERDVALSLSASDWRGLNRNQDQTAVLESQEQETRIRKLTPRECWRLQAFPDSAFDKAQAAGVSNSQLYKQAGNAVTVTTVHALLERLNLLLKSL